MTTIDTYLTFDGNCEQAFNFYKAAFGGEFSFLGRFKDIPKEDASKVDVEQMEKIMHISLPIGNTTLMGCDSGGEWGTNIKKGNNFSVSNTKGRETFASHKRSHIIPSHT